MCESVTNYSTLDPVECANPHHFPRPVNSGVVCMWCCQVKYCSNECRTSHWPEHSCIKVEVKAVARTLVSNIGVFATKDIPQGGLIMRVMASWAVELTRWMPRVGKIAFDDGVFTVDPASEFMKMVDPYYRPVGPVRNLDEILFSQQSMYPRFAEPNAQIKIHPDKLLFLIATQPIAAGQEIFYHWGFSTAFFDELTRYNFGLPTETVNGVKMIRKGNLPYGMPRTLDWTYPGFLAYIKARWPTTADVSITTEDDIVQIVVYRSPSQTLGSVSRSEIRVHRSRVQLETIWEFHIPVIVFY